MLRVSDGRIIDSAGAPLQLRGTCVGGWMNMWGFIAASIVPTVAPLVGQSYGWNAVILLNAFVTLCGVAAFLLDVTNRNRSVTRIVR